MHAIIIWQRDLAEVTGRGLGAGQHVLCNAIDDVHLQQPEATYPRSHDRLGWRYIPVPTWPHQKMVWHSEDSQERSTLDKPNVVSQQEASDILDEKP